VRICEFWYGDPGEEGLIVLRQGTKNQLNAMAAAEGKPSAEIAKVNKGTIAACALWFPGITDKSTGEDFEAFTQDDYDRYVDGKPRYEGVQSFLESRGIELPRGEPSDPLDAETVDGLGNRKNELVLELIRTQGVEPYEGSVRYLHAARDAGFHRAVVSSSANCKDVLEAAGIEDLLEVRMDGVVAERDHIKGKPAPDTYLKAAEMLGAEPGRCAVYEDALAGVESGRAGHFGCVVGVDRVGQADALKEHGASVVVKDLADLLDEQ
jgi:HAD superfamily hydrolase (TIGR01509 family)